MSESNAIQTERSILTVGVLRQALSEFHESDVVMVEDGGFNEGVVVERVRTIPWGMRIVIRAPETDWGPDSPGYDEMGQ